MAAHPGDQIQMQLEQLRPRLHRYCARMVGSAADGEDVVQDAMIKACDALPRVGVVDNLERWLFRIAHNTALDFVRRRSRNPETQSEESLDMVAAPDDAYQADDIVATSLRTFMRLPALQRSTVILKDVLGHSLDEVASITGVSMAAAKSALQRGRLRLRELATEPEAAAAPRLSDAMRARLDAYVDGFIAGDFDAVRAMLADDVKLDLVARLQKQGKSQVAVYLDRYAASMQWAFAAGMVDGRAAMLVYDREVSLETPAYFVTLDFDGDRVVSIHDFLFARYAMEGAEIHRASR
jgi:RNA polymerase sigma-70 factor (ECF subfamily)